MKKISIYQMAACSIMAAIMCVLGPISVPIGPIPVSLTNLVVFFTIILLGTKLSMISVLVYLMLGLVGLPVFSGYVGGPAKLAGPTGGYLIGFFFMILIGGIAYERSKRKPVITAIGMVIGLFVDYAFGTAWFMFQMQTELVYSLSVCVWPFIPFDLIKIALAILLGGTIRNALVKAGIKLYSTENERKQ